MLNPDRNSKEKDIICTEYNNYLDEKIIHTIDERIITHLETREQDLPSLDDKIDRAERDNRNQGPER